MLSPEELGWDAGRYARAWLGERARVTAELAEAVARDADEHALHDLRVSCRRLREAIAFFEGVAGLPDLGKVGRAAKRMASALNTLRELDVAARRLSQLDDGAPLDARAQAARRRLAAEVSDLRRAHTAGKSGRIARRARKLQATLAARLPSGDDGEPPGPDDAGAEPRTRRLLVDRLAERRARVDALAARLRRRAEPDAELLHRARVALKHWRYALEIARPALPREQHTPLAAELRRLQDMGGRSQDLSDLALRVERAFLDAGRRERKGLAELLQLTVAEREAALAAFAEALRHLPSAAASRLRPVPTPAAPGPDALN